MDDSRIIELYFKRDESAIRYTSEKYGRQLRALSNRIVHNVQTAEECENDTYRKAWESIPPHKPVDYLYAYLARIIRRLSLNCCRHRNRLKRSAHICELSAELEQCIPCPDDCAARVDDLAFAELLNGFLRTLNTEKRNLFLRRYWFTDSISEIAQVYGMSESKVKTTLFRVRSQFKNYLEKEGYTL